jgi:hypothetical protein
MQALGGHQYGLAQQPLAASAVCDELQFDLDYKGIQPGMVARLLSTWQDSLKTCEKEAVTTLLKLWRALPLQPFLSCDAVTN